MLQSLTTLIFFGENQWYKDIVSSFDVYVRQVEESHPLIRENFKEWRDYLYKFILVMTAISGSFVTLLSANWTRVIPDTGNIFLAFTLIGVAIGIGILGMFATIYIEKKIIDARVEFALGGQFQGERVNPIDAIKMDAKKLVKENQMKLKLETDPEEIRWLKVKIKADRRVARLMKYVAAPAVWYEYVRTSITTLMLILTFSGIIILMNELLSNSLPPVNTKEVLRNI